MSQFNSNNKSVRTRFAPSPTGYMHIGSLRTALYEYAFAKSFAGKFILRIEDTDRNRYVPGATEKIYDMLKLFGLNWDEGPLVGGSHSPYIQSERVKTGIYQKVAEKLVLEKHAYYCFCQAKSKEEIKEEHEEGLISFRDENCRNLTPSQVEEKLHSGLKPAIRLRVPENETVKFYDFIRGKEIFWNTKEVDEVMLLKSDGFPTYHLAVVVDDVEMEISHILRAHEWLPSTPVHILLYQYLNYQTPQVGHFTVILDPEGGKLSKRKGNVSVEEFLAEGYLPEAILNYIMLLGWAPKDNRELFTLQELVDNFQKGSLQIANPVFNQKKLDWFNGYYIRQKTDQELFELLRKFVPENADVDLINKTVHLVKDRITKLSDYSSLVGFFFKEPEINEELFEENAKVQLVGALEILESLGTWDKENLESALQNFIKQNNWNTGQFFMNFRIAITGSRFTPPITDSAEILGKEKTRERIKKALSLLTSTS